MTRLRERLRGSVTWLIACIIGIGLPGAVLAAAADREIAHLLGQPEAPAGVVFEIVSGDPEGLRESLPRVRDYVQRLRERFPGVELAVVTHGQEQFALQSAHRGEQEEVHRQVQSLVGDQQVPVHVCETYAGWRGVTAEDFPEYVDVAPSGPAQVRAYRDVGYTVIVVQ